MKKTPESFNEKAKEYFDEKKYRTVIVGKQGIKNNDDLVEAIEALADNKLTADEREEALKHLKASNPRQALLKAIDEAVSDEKRARLIAACWEIDMDCTKDFLFFVNQACSDDFNVALEALTVIENIENEIGDNELEEAKKIVSAKIKLKTENIDLQVDLLQIIKDRGKA
jgi:hypothetical protein